MLVASFLQHRELPISGVLELWQKQPAKRGSRWRHPKMAEFFLELISEQIPSRFQQFGAETLAKELEKRLSALHPKVKTLISDPRRIGCILDINSEISAKTTLIKGPKLTAPEKAIAGFARKYGVSPKALKQENGAFFFEENLPARSAQEILKEEIPSLLWNFPWPKAMRWGAGSRFAWVRPLHKIVCLLENQLISFSLERDGDHAHSLKSGDVSEDGPFGYQEAFKVTSAQTWENRLRSKGLIPFHKERLEKIKTSLEEISQAKNLTVILNDRLLNEVTGLCEIPTAYLGQIEASHMALPHEVRDDLMEEHQRYFPLSQNGKEAPFFAFVANHPFDDNELVSHGNERVLRARLEDGRHFWTQDQKKPLESRVDDLEKMTFQEGLGSQKNRALRLEKLSEKIAKTLGYDANLQKMAGRAGLLLKADLVTEMVGELPSLQGIIGGYYAEHDKETPKIVEAIKQQYLPRGNSGEVPENPVSISAALADRIDTLVKFFSIGLTPTGSGDPFGLRRVALGIFRILQHNHIKADLGELLALASDGTLPENLEDFLIDRLRVQLRQENIEAGIAEAILNLDNTTSENAKIFKKLDGKIISEIFKRASLLQAAEENISGWPDLLNAYRRASSILQAEIKKGWKQQGRIESNLLTSKEETAFFKELKEARPVILEKLQERDFQKAIEIFAQLYRAVDAFFENVLVNDPDEHIRHNRLMLISNFCNLCNRVADFSKIEKKG
ncbi:glycine--tRNA ligase subunit beta [Acetobacteraceae bacterium]|nr:glycine--tRNA ligase subunit beta [Acetobacteraceae bacterium]